MDMKTLSRRSILSLGAGAALMPMFGELVFAGQPMSFIYPMKPEKITDGVWVIYGAQDKITAKNGGAIANVTILDTKEGAVVVDTGPSHRYGMQLQAMAKQLTGKPVARVYVTHIHADHSLGSTAFDPKTLYGTDVLEADFRLRGNDISNAMYRVAGDWMRGTDVPNLTHAVKDGVEEIGGRKFRCLALKGHSSSDLCLYEETSGLLLAGDLVFLDRAPTTPDADIPAWYDSLKKVADIPHAKLIPGHGPVEPGARGIEQTHKWLEFVDSTISHHFDNGLDVTEIMAQPIPNWTKDIAASRYEYQRSVMHLLPHLEESKLPILTA